MPKRLHAVLATLLLLACVAPATTSHAQIPPPAPIAATRPAVTAMEAKPLNVAGRPARESATSRPAAGRSMSTLGGDLGRMFLALGIVLAIIGAIYWLFRRFYGGAVSSMTTHAVKVLSRTPIAPRQQVMLLKVGRRVVVVGDSNGSLSTLSQIDDADEVAQLLGQLQAEQMTRAASFGNVFRRNQTNFDDVEPPPRRGATGEEMTTVPDDAAEPATPADDELSRQRSEIAGLLEKVRSLRGQIGP